MAETLFNQFADEGALLAQRDFFLNEVLKPIKEGIKNTNVKITTIDSSQSKRNVDELSHAVDVLTTEINNAQQTMLGMSKTMRDFIEASAGTTKAQKDIAKATLDSVKAQKELAAAGLLQAKTDAEIAKASKGKAQSAKEIAKAQLAEQKAAEEAANDYLQLAKAYNEAALKAKNYVLRLGEQHPISVQAVRDANEMANILKKLDASVGQNQRNVGDYKSAVAGLGYSFTQVSRELPSLAVNFQQFALAISNNLPYVFEGLKNTVREINALKAAGKEAPSIFSAIGRSIFSWQVALSVGITLFTIYAKKIEEFFTKLIQGKSAFDQIKEANNSLNAALKDGNTEYGKAVEEIDNLRINVDLARKGFVKKEDVVRQYNETVGDTIGKVTSLDEVEQSLVKNADNYIRFTLLKAAANIALAQAASLTVEQALADQKTLQQLAKEFPKTLPTDEKGKPKITTSDADQSGLTEAEKRQQQKAKVERRNNIVKEREEVRAQQQERIDGLRDIAENFRKQAALLFNVFDFDNGGGANSAVKSIGKLLTAEIENARDTQLKISENEKIFIAERLKARENALIIDKNLATLKTNFEIDEAKRAAAEQIKAQKGNTENIKTIQSNLAKEIAYIKDKALREDFLLQSKYDEDVIKLQNEFYQELIKNVAENEKVLREAKKQNIQDRTNAAKNDYDEELILIGKFYEQDNAILQSNLKRKRIKLDDYNNQRRINDKNEQKARIEAEIAYTKELIEIEKLKPNGGNTAELKRKLYALEKGLRDSDLKDYEDYANKLAEINKKIVEDQKKAFEKLTDQLKDTFFAVLAGGYDAQINKIRDQIDAVNELKAAEIERVNSSTGTAEEKAARIKIIEARAQNDREALERRQRKIERDRAIVERAQSAFSITIAGIRDVARIKSASAVAYANTLATIPPPFNVPAAIATRLNVLKEIPISIATTAASLAAILATPIPKFFKGTESSPEGLAEVAERGPELAIDPKGKAKLYDKHTLTYLTKGTKIYPADATKDILNAAENERSGLLKSFEKNITISAPDHSEELKAQTKLLKEIKDKPVMLIQNEAGIESKPWFIQHFKS